MTALKLLVFQMTSSPTTQTGYLVRPMRIGVTKASPITPSGNDSTCWSKHANMQDGCYTALIVEYDEKFKYLKERAVDCPFKSSNKGFEAVVHIGRQGEDYLLALCEGNKGKGGAKGRTPGGGRVQVFHKTRKNWRHCRAIPLPSSLPFVDYSGMSIDDGRVAIVSQVNSMLWVGQLNQADWT